MTKETLKRAMEIKEQLHELDVFLHVARKVPKLNLTKVQPKMLFNTISYGALESRSIDLDRTLGDRLLEVVEQYQEELKEEFEQLS